MNAPTLAPAPRTCAADVSPVVDQVLRALTDPGYRDGLIDGHRAAGRDDLADRYEQLIADWQAAS